MSAPSSKPAREFSSNLEGTALLVAWPSWIPAHQRSRPSIVCRGPVPNEGMDYSRRKTARYSLWDLGVATIPMFRPWLDSELDRGWMTATELLQVTDVDLADQSQAALRWRLV